MLFNICENYFPQGFWYLERPIPQWLRYRFGIIALVICHIRRPLVINTGWNIIPTTNQPTNDCSPRSPSGFCISCLEATVDTSRDPSNPPHWNHYFRLETAILGEAKSLYITSLICAFFSLWIWASKYQMIGTIEIGTSKTFFKNSKAIDYKFSNKEIVLSFSMTCEVL